MSKRGSSKDAENRIFSVWLSKDSVRKPREARVRKHIENWLAQYEENEPQVKNPLKEIFLRMFEESLGYDAPKPIDTTKEILWLAKKQHATVVGLLEEIRDTYPDIVDSAVGRHNRRVEERGTGIPIDDTLMRGTTQNILRED